MQKVDPKEVWKRAYELAMEHPNLDLDRQVERLEVLDDGSVLVHNNADWKK